MTMLVSNIFKSQMPRILGICFLVSLAFSFGSCEPVDQPVDEPSDSTAVDTPVDSTEYTIKLSAKADFDMPAESSTKTVIFTCDGPWIIEIPEDAQSWITADPMSGEASAKRQSVKFTLADNAGAERKATCYIKAGISKERVKFTQQQVTLTLTAADVEDYERIYIPNVDFDGDPLKSNSTWSFCRSKQSEHFIVFWDIKYGEYGLYGDKMGVENTSPTTCKNTSMQVDIDELLEKAEQYFDLNINKLGFADISGGHSTLDDYKMGICLHYTSTWTAYGSGYDNVVGWLWINPATCKPIGSTIAHEIGHSFQYQTYCDQIHYNGKPDNQQTGWRYGFGGNGGNAYWEQTAQWQSYQSYTNEAFETVNFTEFVNNCHRHFHHEHQRYASYFMHWYMVQKRGWSVIGELWRESYSPYDAVETYQQKYNLSMDELSAELYDYAAQCVTWDFDLPGMNMHTGLEQSVRDFGKNYIGKIGWKSSYDKETGFYSVTDERAPEATGFNHIRLNVPAAGTTVKVTFEGKAKAQAEKAGWNVGFVALKNNGERVYSDDVRILADGVASFEVPADCQDLWLVVAATPQVYFQHAWDDDNTNDVVWHYAVKIEGTDLYGTVTFDGTEVPSSTTVTKNYDLSCAAGYAGGSIAISGAELIQIAKAFVLQPSEIASKLSSGAIKFQSIEPDGSLYTGNYTANGFGYWYGADGSVQSWGMASVFAEYNADTWTFGVGCHPDKVSTGALKPGDKVTVKPTLVYGDYMATIEINFTMVD